MESIGWQDLETHGRGASVIVSRFTFLIEDFVICCCQVTKLFCAKGRASPVRLLQEAFVIFVHSQEDVETIGLSET